MCRNWNLKLNCPIGGTDSNISHTLDRLGFAQKWAAHLKQSPDQSCVQQQVILRLLRPAKGSPSREEISDERAQVLRKGSRPEAGSLQLGCQGGARECQWGTAISAHKTQLTQVTTLMLFTTEILQSFYNDMIKLGRGQHVFIFWLSIYKWNLPVPWH